MNSDKTKEALLADLPKEILVHILHYLSGDDLSRFKWLSRWISTLLEENKRTIPHQRPSVELDLQLIASYGIFNRHQTFVDTLGRSKLWTFPVASMDVIRRWSAVEMKSKRGVFVAQLRATGTDTKEQRNRSSKGDFFGGWRAIGWSRKIRHRQYSEYLRPYSENKVERFFNWLLQKVDIENLKLHCEIQPDTQRSFVSAVISCRPRIEKVTLAMGVLVTTDYRTECKVPHGILGYGWGCKGNCKDENQVEYQLPEDYWKSTTLELIGNSAIMQSFPTILRHMRKLCALFKQVTLLCDDNVECTINSIATIFARFPDEPFVFEVLFNEMKDWSTAGFARAPSSQHDYIRGLRELGVELCRRLREEDWHDLLLSPDDDVLTMERNSDGKTLRIDMERVAPLITRLKFQIE